MLPLSLEPQPPRNWFDRLIAGQDRRRDARPPATTRIVARPAAAAR